MTVQGCKDASHIDYCILAVFFCRHGNVESMIRSDSMTKRIFTLSAALALLLTGCSGSPAQVSSETKVQQNPVLTDNGKTVLKIAVAGGMPLAFSDSMNMPSDIKLERTDYFKGLDDPSHPDSLAAVRRSIEMNMISGNVPDMFVLPPVYARIFIDCGLTADLFGCMEKYGGIQKEDFLPNMLEGMTVEGRMPAMVQTVYIKTAAAKTRFVPKEYENWTPQQAMDFYDKAHELGMSFMGEESSWENDALPRYFLTQSASGCIDLSALTCDFFSGSFIPALDFCASHTPAETYHGDDTDVDTSGLDDSRLVFPFMINGFNDALAEDTYGRLGGEDITFVGYPSDDGCGTEVICNGDMIGITSVCSSEEKAWELTGVWMKWQKKLEKHMHDGTRGIPVLKEALDRDYRRPDDYGNSINRVQYRLTGNSSFEEYTVPQDYKDMLYDYILRVKFRPYEPVQFMNMVFEETAPVIAGERSAEKCAGILQGRITTYLSEKS